MAEILTCTWAPTALSGPQLLGRPARRLIPDASGDDLRPSMIEPVLRAEQLGIDFMLVAQRWWGTGQEIEGSSYDCLAMTAYYAAITRRLRFITCAPSWLRTKRQEASASEILSRFNAIEVV